MNLIDDNILNIYRYGSFVYGSNDELSDEDFIIVTKNKVISNDPNHSYYLLSEFNDLAADQDISILECLFLPPECILKETFKIPYFSNKISLRHSISQKASHSWVKGKKKLIVEEDFNLRAGLKSYYHSFRILDYGIQLAQHNQIHNYQSMNHILLDLKELSKIYEGKELVNQIEKKYKSLYNSMSTQFKLLAPKE